MPIVEQSNTLKVGPLGLEAFHDYIVVVRDEFRSGYECTACEGEGENRCPSCLGAGRSLVTTGARCSMCSGRGKVVCEDCKGKGVVKGGIHIPDNKQNEPTTGTIVSCGPDVKLLSNGQSVMFPSYAGHQLELGGEDPETGEEKKYLVVICHETEVICKVSGHLELRRLKKKVAASTTA